MPLTADIDGVRAKITASVSSVEASVEAQANSVKAGVSGRATASQRTDCCMLTTAKTVTG